MSDYEDEGMDGSEEDKGYVYSEGEGGGSEEGDEEETLISSDSGGYGIVDNLHRQKEIKRELSSVVDLICSPGSPHNRRDKLKVLIDVLFVMPRTEEFVPGKVARQHFQEAAAWGKYQSSENRRRYTGDVAALSFLLDGFPDNLNAATTRLARIALCRSAEQVGDIVEMAERRAEAETRTVAAGQMSAVAAISSDLVSSPH